MANIPHKFTMEAQEERDMRASLSGPKDRWSWYGWGDNYDEIDFKKDKDVEERD